MTATDLQQPVSVAKRPPVERPLHPDEKLLTAELERALRQTIFSSGLRVSPRRMREISQEMAAAFIRFLGHTSAGRTSAETETKEQIHVEQRGKGLPTEPHAYGRRLAGEELGHHSILTMTETLRHICWEHNLTIEMLSLSGRYVNALLEGYMVGRWEDLLREQERTYQALLRALEGQTPAPQAQLRTLASPTEPPAESGD